MAIGRPHAEWDEPPEEDWGPTNPEPGLPALKSIPVAMGKAAGEAMARAFLAAGLFDLSPEALLREREMWKGKRST